MNSINSTAQYVYDSIQNYETNTNIELPFVENMIREEILNQIDNYFHATDMERLETHIDNDAAIEKYYQERFPDYQKLLSDIAKDILTEYVIVDLQNE